MPDWGDDTAYFFMLKQEPEGWTATPICQGAFRSWAWPGTLQQPGPDPVAVCASNYGSGSVLTLAAYRGEREVLRVAGLQECTYQVIPAANGEPPTIVVYGTLGWLGHKLDPTVLERFTFTWQGDVYKLSRRERMAEAPAGGLADYLQKNAPDMTPSAGSVWGTTGYHSPGGQAYFHQDRDESGPWFRFDLAPDGRILAVSQVAEPPTQP